MSFIADPVAFLESLYRVAVDAAQPHKSVAQYMPKPPENGRVFVVGAGKASAQMAQAFEQNWQHHETYPLSGIVITRYGYSCPCEHIDILEAAHPLPDEAGLKATAELMAFLDNAALTENDLVVCLISGGGSALLVQPVECISFQEKADINLALLKSGAPIQDMNVVRKSMSQIKGGGLARLCIPARLHSLIISDVAGDDLGSIASAPTIISKPLSIEALTIIDKYKLDVPDALRSFLESQTIEQQNVQDEIRQDIYVIASAKVSLEAAAQEAMKQAGLHVEIISDALEGESGACANMHADLLKKQSHLPCLLLSGGETTVHVTGQGRGGNNGQFALEALKLLGKDANIYGLAADTDGIDGSEDNAGAFFTADLYQKALSEGLNINEYIQNNDSYGFFEQVDGLLMTGPTQTNVNDFRAILKLA